MAKTYVVFDDVQRVARGVYSSNGEALRKVRGGSIDRVKEVDLDALMQEAADMQEGGKIALVAQMEKGEIDAFTEYYRMIRNDEW